MFMDMTDSIKEETLEFLLKVQTIEEKKRAGVFETVAKQFTHEEKESFKGMPARQERELEGAPMPQGMPPSPHESEKVRPIKGKPQRSAGTTRALAR